MRVLLIHRNLPVHGAGGLQNHVHDLALGLAGKGCCVHLLSSSAPQDAREFYSHCGVTLHGVRFANPKRYTIAYMCGIGRAIDRILDENSIDVIHAHEFSLGLWVPPLGAPPLVLSVHGTITSETPLHYDVYSTLRPIERLLSWIQYGPRYLYAPIWRRALRFSSRILIDSEFTRNELQRLAPEIIPKVACAPLGVREPDAIALDYGSARAMLGWSGMQLITTGRLEWQKGHEIALLALDRLRCHPWRYTIIGTGAYTEKLRRMISRLGLTDRVALAGCVSEETKRLMLASADLFLWPERTHPAFGLAGLEARLASTPVLAMRRGAIPEVMGAIGGCLVDDPSPESFAARLAPFLANPEYLYAMRWGLRQETLERFSFDRMITNIVRQYQEALPIQFEDASDSRRNN